MYLVLDFDEFAALARSIKRDLLPDWEPVLMAHGDVFAVDTDYHLAFSVKDTVAQVTQLQPGYAARLAGDSGVFGMLDRNTLRAQMMDLRDLNEMYPGWMRVIDLG